VLKEAAGEPDDEVRIRALTAIPTLGQSVPEAASFLWELARSPEGKASRLSLASGQAALTSIGGLGPPMTFNGWALKALADVGFSSSDLPSLAEVLGGVDDDSVRWEAPGYIAETIAKDAAAAEPFLPAIEDLLAHTNAEVRFAAACALARSQGAQDPRIYQELAVRLKPSSGSVPRRGFDVRDVRNASAIAGALEGAGPSAGPLVPDLLRLAQSGAVPAELRQRLLAAAGNLDGELQNQLPEVAAAVRSEQARGFNSIQLPAGSFSITNPIAQLKDPQLGPTVAAVLSQAGPTNIGLLPYLIDGYLAQTNPVARQKMLESIHRISPAFSPEEINPQRRP